MTTRRPGRPKAAPGELGPGVGDRRLEVVGDQHALARGQAVRLDHPRPGQRPQELDGRTDLVEDAVRRGGNAGLRQNVLHPGFGALQPGPVRARPEDQAPGGSQPVRQPVDQRLLRADHEQVGRRPSSGGPATQATPRAAIPALPGQTTTSAVRPSARARACSRPPEPATHTRRRCQPAVGGRHYGANLTNCSRPGPDSRPA